MDAHDAGANALRKHRDRPGKDPRRLINYGSIERGPEALSQENRRAADAEALSTRRLTDHQVRVLQMLADGWDYNDIAKELRMKPGSVKNLSYVVQLKLGADNKTHAVAQGLRRGLIQ